MRQNLVLVHLESISQMAFWQYADEMKTLFDLSQNSIAFTRFFASSTSSVMSMSDLMHATSCEMDHLEVFPKDRSSLAGESQNLFRSLRRHGYETLGLQYGSFCLGDAPNNFWGIWPEECGQFQWYNDRETMHSEVYSFVKNAKRKNENFALYFWNMNSHLRDEDPLKGGEASYSDRFRAGYRLTDMSVRRLLDDLSNLSVLENTVVVAVGDHGDDLWRHGLYKGRSHIIDPYSTVCWCPFFIFHNGRITGLNDKLASMVDVEPTIMSALFPGADQPPPTNLCSGINLQTLSRSVAFSQSMFALQRERSDPAKVITKSYAVTDGNYRLIASNPSDIDDSGGLELFFEQWDYGNTRNLLDFCSLDSTGKITKFGLKDAVHPHFFMTFTPKTIQNLVAEYDALRGHLFTFIKQKEQMALKRFKGVRPHVFPEDVFMRSRKKKR